MRISALLARANLGDYIALTKPRVISLLLFTTVGAMFIAAQGFPGWIPLGGLLVGGYMSAGAAGVYNMIYDRDIDAVMKRTSLRPTVTEVIPIFNALVFAIVLTVISFILIAVSTNLLAAVLSWSGIAFYVVVYTVWLKRSTWQNIVIGGAAGSIPPLVGWAAVTGDLSLMAWCLFALIFVWTPVHFWALALMIDDDYKAVGIPMAPSVIGVRATVLQMVIYTVLTILLTIIPFVLGELTWVYLVIALLLNALLVHYVVRLWRQAGIRIKIERAIALPLYKYSMIYLALIFFAMSLDRVLLQV